MIEPPARDVAIRLRRCGPGCALPLQRAAALDVRQPTGPGGMSGGFYRREAARVISSPGAAARFDRPHPLPGRPGARATSVTGDRSAPRGRRACRPGADTGRRRRAPPRRCAPSGSSRGRPSARRHRTAPGPIGTQSRQPLRAFVRMAEMRRPIAPRRPRRRDRPAPGGVMMGSLALTRKLKIED